MLAGTISATSTVAAFAPSRAWALELHTISQADSEAIVAFSRVLYPHATLPTAVYALVAKDLDKDAAKDAKNAAILHDGTAALDKAVGGHFVSATDEAKRSAAKALEGTPYFKLVRSTCITSLYDNDMAYAHFGYEGASWPKGGYIHRGFSDLTWLPNPPDTASPVIGAK
ncbi:MAG: hypothetical protein NVS2B8_20910 [Vulcanimicrobiaceae bacterium]